MGRVLKNIPVKLCISILLIESFLLTCMGMYYVRKFHNEIDHRVTEKLALPALLMSERALSYSSVEQLHILSDLIHEQVTQAFVINRDGKVFFSSNKTTEGKNYQDSLGKDVSALLHDDLGSRQQISFIDDTNTLKLSMFSPITHKGRQLGSLYLCINGEQIALEKQKMVLLFFFGALVTIILTTLLEAWFVYRMVVPRIQKTSSVLQRIAKGDFSIRLDNPGIEDELGTLMDQVNDMIDTVERYTGKLKVLNTAAEALNQTGSKQEIITKAVEVLERQLPVKLDKNYLLEGRSYATRLAVGHNTIFTLPIVDNEENYSIVPFLGTENYKELTPEDMEFVATLSRMVSVALGKMRAFQEVTTAEERYRHLFTSAAEGIYRTSLAGKILEANPALAEMVGYDDVDQMLQAISHSAADLYADPAAGERVFTPLQHDDIVNDIELYLRRKNGSVFPASLSAYAVRDDDGQLKAYDVRLSDISERKLRERAERDQLAAEAASKAKTKVVDDLEIKNTQLVNALNELKATQVQLMQSEKMAAVGMTAGGVAHDLNNILSAMATYPDLLLSRLTPDSDMYEPLERIRTAGRRAAAIVADLLTLTQGTVRLNKKISLTTIIDEYFQSADFKQLMAGRESVDCVCEVSDEEAVIRCSPIHIRKVIANLVTNAVESVGEMGKVVISTAVERAEADQPSYEDGYNDDYVILHIADNGPGITQENLKHIFEPFYTQKVMGFGGAGLGLPVVWNVVNEHGGEIEVESGTTGTVFSVILPLADERDDLYDGEPEDGDFSGTGHILVIDDEPLQQDIASKILHDLGYRVSVCSSGEQAIAMLSDESADLLVLDMLMPPGIGGYETYKKVLEIQPVQKAVIVSGYSESKDVKRTMQLGAGAFIKKPYSMTQLARTVKAVMDSPHPATTDEPLSEGLEQPVTSQN